MLLKFNWNSRWILFFLSILDVLIILFLSPAKTRADIPQSSSASTISGTILAPASEQNTEEDEINTVSELLNGKRSPTVQSADSTEDQVNSVSQLSDIKPSDWAFQALQSLVERYGVITGYPNLTFKGNRTLTRYEFAAGLNAAIERLRELLATNTSNLVRKEDWETLQKLQNQFSPELTAPAGTS